MIEIYATNASLLLFVGFVTTVYVLYYVKMNGLKSNTVLSTSEALATLFIGAFYVYCTVELVENMEIPVPVSAYENTIVNSTNNGITEDLFVKPVQNNNPQDLHSESTNLEENKQNSTDKFLQQYQQLLKDMIFKKQGENRRTRTAFKETETDCLYKTFLRRAMLICSFVQSISFLINITIDCKRCKGNIKLPASDNSTENNLDKHETDTQDTTTKINCNKHLQISDTNHPQSQIVFCVVLDWLAPAVAILMLYYAVMGRNKNDIAVINKFNATEIYLGAMENSNNHISYSNTNSEEVANIINNVYKIIAQENKTISPMPAVTPAMYDIINYLNKKQKHQDICGEKVDKIAMKAYVFILVITGYFLTILYTKIKEYQLGDSDKTKQLKMNIYIFTAVWFPAVVDLAIRTYITEDMPGIISDLFTLLGNSNHLLINIKNILMLRTSMKTHNFVTPNA